MKVGGVAVVAAAAAVVALTGCGSGDGSAEAEATSSTSSSTSSMSSSTTEETPPIQLVANDCLRGHITQDDGMSITLDTQGPGEGNTKIHDRIEDVSCLLTGLEAPDHVAQHINSTRALDGQQTDGWDHYEARWTYHPDDGLQITIIDRS